jgi:hypothetical protein
VARIAALLALGAALACVGGAGQPIDSCRLNSDCPYGQYCRPTADAGAPAAGVCAIDCREERDCPRGRPYCDEARGQCLACEGDPDCAPLGFCLRGECVFPSDGGPDEGPRDGRDGSADRPLDRPADPVPDEPPPLDRPPDRPPEVPRDRADGGPGRGGYLDECGTGGDCASGLCAEHPMSGRRTCAKEGCASDRDCALGDVCVPSGTRRLCLPTDLGRTCTPTAEGARVCSFGLCLGASGNAACTRPCTGAGECPAGWSCSATGMAPPAPARVCMPVERQPACSRAAPCSVGLCVGTAEPGRCLGECRSAGDCPADHPCTPVAEVSVCVPPASGTGGLGAACGGSGAACRSGLCADVCVAPCAVTAGAGQACPGGFGCAPVEEGPGSSVLVCVPAGAGGAGAACRGNSSDCESGVCAMTSDTAGYCTKVCNDTFCPTGLRCADAGMTASGVALRVCQR